MIRLTSVIIRALKLIITSVKYLIKDGGRCTMGENGTSTMVVDIGTEMMNVRTPHYTYKLHNLRKLAFVDILQRI